MIPVMPVSALADGDKALVRLQGQEVLICRSDGRYYAVAPRCTHAGQSLQGGRLSGCELSCPLHGARFDIRDGRALKAPAGEGLVTYPVLIEGGKVHVAVDRPRAPRPPL